MKRKKKLKSRVLTSTCIEYVPLLRLALRGKCIDKKMQSAKFYVLCLPLP